MVAQIIPILFIGVVLLFIAFGMFRSHFAEKKRRTDMQEVADKLGLDWTESSTLEQLGDFANFNLFNRGRSKKIHHVIDGVTDEVRICIFDYRFTTGQGKNQRTVKQTVASLMSPQMNCPEFSMRPEGILDRVGGLLGFQDIDFDSHPKFSKSFVLKGPNEEQVRAFFRPPVLEFFETQAGVNVEGMGDRICFYRANRIVKSQDIKNLLGDAYRVFGSLVDA